MIQHEGRNSNDLLYHLKSRWLEGDSQDEQRQQALIVADWLEEAGETGMAEALRSPAWVLCHTGDWGDYRAVSQDAFVKEGCPVTPVHWYPMWTARTRNPTDAEIAAQELEWGLFYHDEAPR